jgi:hypothetical protein
MGLDDRISHRMTWGTAAVLAGLLVGLTGCEGSSDDSSDTPAVESTSSIEATLSPVTTGEGDSRATPYPTANPSPSIVVETGSLSYQFRSEDLAPGWLTESVAQTELVIDANISWQEINSASYGYTATLTRRRNVAHIRVLNATTAEEVAVKDFTGKDPGGFPATWTFNSALSTEYLDGEEVADATINDWLRTYIEH